MKNKVVLSVTALLMIILLASCTNLWIKSNERTATATNQAKLPNPASVYCEQNGNTHIIVTAADGSQSGVCVLPDGSTCDEWAYFRGECGVVTPTNPKIDPTGEPTIIASGGYMQPGSSEPIDNWWGVIKSTEPGAQYDDYFERQDLGGAILFGINSLDPEIESQIEAIRDSGRIVHIYGTLFSNVPDYNGSQVQVDRVEIQE